MMIRSFFFGLGVFVALSGLSLFAIDGVLLTEEHSGRSTTVSSFVRQDTPDGRELINPPDWVAYTLAGMGGLTMLYSVALPKSSY